MLAPLLLMTLGLAILVAGAEFLVRGAVGLARALGVSPLVIGLTVVSFGTSSPEFAVAVKAAFGGAGDLSIGNIAGSNLFNTALILGISAIVCPLAVNLQVVRLDLPVMLAASVLFTVFCLTGKTLEVWEGAILFALVIAYTVFLIRLSRREEAIAAAAEAAVAEAGPEPETGARRPWVHLLLFFIGLAALIYGSTVLVDNAVIAARLLGWSEALIGLTIVAVGTSLPELAASIAAAAKKETDMAVGNIVGSNTFNVLSIGGAAGILGPVRMDGIELLDFGAMLLVSFLLIPLMWRGFRIQRWEGAVLVAIFGAYLALRWP